MKKPYKHTELSTERFCVSCGGALKLNLLHRKPNAKKCYKCTKAERG